MKFTDKLLSRLRALCRKTDPVTSKLAAQDAQDILSLHARMIVAALRMGPAGKDGIAYRAGLSGVAVCRRLKDMERAGLIEQTGKHVMSKAKRPEREWRLCE